MPELSSYEYDKFGKTGVRVSIEQAVTVTIMFYTHDELEITPFTSETNVYNCKLKSGIYFLISKLIFCFFMSRKMQLVYLLF